MCADVEQHIRKHRHHLFSVVRESKLACLEGFEYYDWSVVHVSSMNVDHATCEHLNMNVLKHDWQISLPPLELVEHTIIRLRVVP